MSGNDYIIIYAFILLQFLICVSVKLVLNFIFLSFIEKKVLKKHTKLYFTLSFKSWGFGILSDIIAIGFNIVIGKFFAVKCDIFYIVTGLLISFIALFSFEFIIIFKNMSKRLRMLLSFLLALFTLTYYLHIQLAYTYSFVR